MNKKILVLTLLFMLFSVSFVSAQRMCKSDDVLEVLRKALYIYYTNPDESSFTPEELKDLLGFYVGIQAGQITVDCTAQSDNVDKANALPDTIPSCSDGTKYGKCSSNKPMYCYTGRLVPRCRLCGCPIGQWCDITYVDTSKGNKGQWGKCNPGTNITCTVNTDCGISSYVGNYSCINLDVYRNYTKHTCLNPGAINSTCTNNTIPVLIDDCQTGEQCIEGQAECQVGTPGEQPYSIVIKGRMIDAVTGGPWTNLKLMRAEQSNTTPITVAETDSNGYFTINVYNFTGIYSFVSWPTCGYQFGITVQWDSTKNGLVAWIDYLDYNCGSQLFSTTNEIDIGEFKIWPAASIMIKSDAPFTFWVHTLPNTCSKYETKYGNIFYKTTHELSNVLPVNHRTEIELTFQNGSKANTTSDMIGIEQKCQTIQLNYYNGQFSWGQTCTDGTPYGQCSTTKPKYCDNGTLIDNCGYCGCDTSYECSVNGNCIPKSIAITNCVELQNMKNNLAGNYYLANDIDCSDTKNWNNGTGFEPINGFTGFFDGKGYKITRLYINQPDANEVGLFGHIDNPSEIKNIGLEDADVKGYTYVGGLVGYNYGSISNSYITGNVNGLYYTGGLIGKNDHGSVSNSYSTSTVTGTSYVGGLIGQNYYGSVSNSHSTSNTNGLYYTGGLIGKNDLASTVSRSYSTGNVNGGKSNTGGLVGINKGRISDSYTTSNVNGNIYVGGLVGYNIYPVTRSYSIGRVTGTSYVGGLIGLIHPQFPYYVTISYWDTQTSGQTTSDGGTGKTTAEMKQQTTFTGWDFTNTWGICEGITYPWLRWEGISC